VAVASAGPYAKLSVQFSVTKIRIHTYSA